MRIYETAFLIAPNLSEEDTEKLIQQMADVIPAKKGKMIHVDKWGKRKLAYQIKKFEAAYYVFFLYKGEADIPSELERRFKQNEAVIRYLTVKKEVGEEETTPPKKAPQKTKEEVETKPEPEEVETKPEPEVETKPEPEVEEPKPEPEVEEPKPEPEVELKPEKKEKTSKEKSEEEEK
jgi:small subunit ribosomal protein S6